MEPSKYSKSIITLSDITGRSNLRGFRFSLCDCIIYSVFRFVFVSFVSFAFRPLPETLHHRPSPRQIARSTAVFRPSDPPASSDGGPLFVEPRDITKNHLESGPQYIYAYVYSCIYDKSHMFYAWDHLHISTYCTRVRALHAPASCACAFLLRLDMSFIKGGTIRVGFSSPRIYMY